jgi:thiamine biosynthesis lipoprotein
MRGTITLRKPAVLDLGAVVKGLAIDLVARDLQAQGFPNISVEAGGDVLARGRNVHGEPWQIGIQHPRAEGLLVRTLSIDNAAVCTSGTYERGAHVVDARTGEEAGVDGVTVIAPTAMMADGLSTVAMLLGPEGAQPILEREGATALFVSTD